MGACELPRRPACSGRQDAKSGPARFGSDVAKILGDGTARLEASKWIPGSSNKLFDQVAATQTSPPGTRSRSDESSPRAGDPRCARARFQYGQTGADDELV